MSPSVFPHRVPWPERLSEAGGEALLPAGWAIADESRPSRHCYLLLDGEAVVSSGGRRAGLIGPGTFVGAVDGSGRARVPEGCTVRLTSAARVLVLDADRLMALLDADPDLAAAWRQLTEGGRP